VEKQLNFTILDKKRTKLLPLLKEFKNEFYLAGGTGLALQIGHRKSEDFDFFSFKNFNLNSVQEKVNLVFKNYSVKVLQFEPDTFTIIIDDEIKISFFNIQQKVLLPILENEWFKLCTDLEIGAMKIAALLRAAFRDYVDLFFLLKKYKVEDILLLCEKKYPGFEKSVYLKALLSYDDIEITPIQYIEGYERKPKEIFAFIEKQIKLFLTSK